METLVLDEDVLKLSDRAADGGFVHAVGFADVFLGAILAPVHQHHQQSIGQTMIGRFAKGRQALLEDLQHQREDVFGDAGKPLELLGRIGA